MNWVTDLSACQLSGSFRVRSATEGRCQGHDVKAISITDPTDAYPTSSSIMPKV